MARGTAPSKKDDGTSEAPRGTPPGRLREILRILGETYPDAHCELDFRTPLDLLVATILSAQC
ncbi:MAG TPA: endonuclease III, partial [Candidatus Methylomirabilis sp.]